MEATCTNHHLSYRDIVESILGRGELTKELALEIYHLGAEAVVFALLALKANSLSTSDDSLSKPSAMIPAYEKPTTGGSRKQKLGRKPGFEGKSRPSPTRIDRIESHKIEKCPDCGTAVKQEKSPRVRLVEDLPKQATSKVTKHEIYRGWCPKCHKKVEPVVTDALPNSQIGLRLIAFTAWLHYALGTTISQVMGVLNFHLIIKLTGGALVTAWHRLAGILEPWYNQIAAEIKEAKVVHCDETSWRVDGKTHWVWCIASKTQTYYMIERSRGSPGLMRFFTDAFEGTLVTDFWGAYNKVVVLARQMCLAHLLRELSDTTKYKSPSSDWPKFEKSLKRLLRDAIRLGYKRADFSPERYTSRSKRLSERLRLIIEHDWTDSNAQRLVKRLVRHEEHLFTFVNNEGVPFDNNHAEREIRSAVVMRKNSYGNRSEQGARTQAVLMTIFRTLSKTNQNPIDTVVDALKQYVATGVLPPMTMDPGPERLP